MVPRFASSKYASWSMQYRRFPSRFATWTFESHLREIIQFTSSLDNLRLVQAHMAPNVRWHLAGTYLETAKIHEYVITRSRAKWRNVLGISEEDEKRLLRDPKFEKSKFPDYEQTIPINESPLDVFIKISTEADPWADAKRQVGRKSRDTMHRCIEEAPPADVGRCRGHFIGSI